jgi:hypothetical protein
MSEDNSFYYQWATCVVRVEVLDWVSKFNATLSC